MKLRRILSVILLALPAVAGALPEGYEIGEHTLSPDGRHAILFPTKPGNDGEYAPNLLARLEPYAELAKVVDPGLPEGGNTSLLAEWTGEALVMVWTFQRWGIGDLRVLELADGGVSRTHEIWTAVRAEMRRDFRERFLAKFPDEAETILFLSSEGEEDPKSEAEVRGRRVIIDTMADNKPNLAPGPHWSAELKATWNLDSGRLEKVRLKPGAAEMRGQE